MPSEPLFIRWEHTTPPHRKFYELEVELTLFYPKTLIQRWGRLSTKKPRTLHRLIANPAELDRLVARIARRREQHGYHKVSEIYRTSMETIAA